MAVGVCALQACGGHAVDLDRVSGPTILPGEGGGAETIVLPEEITSLFVDDSRIYWRTSGFKFESCLKSECGAITTYANNQAVSVAVGNGHVYWNAIETGQSILSCPSTGCVGAPTRVVEDPSLGSISADGDYVYWVSALDIYRCPYSGCGPTPELVAPQETTLWQLAFQGTNAFWSERQTIAGDPAVIRQVPKDGSAAPSTFLQAATDSLATNAMNVYWLDYSGTVFSCSSSGCGSEGPIPIATDVGRQQGLTVDASSAYWIDNSQEATQVAVHSCPLTGCGSNPTTITPTGVVAFAVDDRYVYWVEVGSQKFGSGKNIHRIPK